MNSRSTFGRLAGRSTARPLISLMPNATVRAVARNVSALKYSAMCVPWTGLRGDATWMPSTIHVIAASTTTDAIGATPYVVASVSWLAFSRRSRGIRFGTDESFAGAHTIWSVSMMNVAIAAQPTTTFVLSVANATVGIDANSTNRLTSQKTIV